MNTISHLKWKLKERFFLNPFFRNIINFVYRKIFFLEKKHFKSYCNSQKKKCLVAINLTDVYFIEHVKDLLNYFKTCSKMASLLIGPAKWPVKKRKVETFNFFASRYNIVYGRNIFAYPWLKKSDIKVFFEVAITTYGCDLKCPKIIYTHGMGGLSFSKDLRHVKLLNKYSAVFLNGPLQKKILVLANKMYGIDKLPPMYEVGYLRGDRLLRMSKVFNKNVFLKQLDLFSVPTVLYAPTWGDFSSVEEWLDKIVNVCKDLGVNLLIKLHPMMLTRTSSWETGGIMWEEKLSDIEKNNCQVRIIKNQDIDEIMLGADVMITDISGMAIEFMVLDKPVVFLPAPKFFQLYGLERPEKWCRPDNEIKNDYELKQEINKAIEGKGYKYPVDKLVYNKGESLGVMVKKIEEIIFS